MSTAKLPVPTSVSTNVRVQLSDSTLDDILMWQFLVAWAGESLSEPSRLGWWRTDLFDEEGGGDLFLRLLPKTHLWAAFEAMREAALRCDQNKRQQIAQADQVNTLFFWGFEYDEQLRDRLVAHKSSQRSPMDCLDWPLEPSSDFKPTEFEEVLASLGNSNDNSFEIVSEGRAIKGTPPQSMSLRAQRLAAALLPLTKSYPMPFYPMQSA